MNKNSLIYVAGHRGLAGSAVIRKLKEQGYHNLLFRTSKELDLRSSAATDDFFARYRPQYVFMCAGRVGGIAANSRYPVEFLQDNILMAVNILSSAAKHHAEKLVYLGSSCIYPKKCPQPIKEEYLLTGLLEPTNEAYALAKITAAKLCTYYKRQYGCNFFYVMPSNLYGLNDNYDPENSHVIAALIRRFHEAKINNLPEIVVWGTGKPLREFTYSDDLADALILLMSKYNDETGVNIGSNHELSIAELAKKIADTVGYNGKILFDAGKPDGTFRKILDISVVKKIGWNPKVSFEQGLMLAYQDFCNNKGIVD